MGPNGRRERNRMVEKHHRRFPSWIHAPSDCRQTRALKFGYLKNERSYVMISIIQHLTHAGKLIILISHTRRVDSFVWTWIQVCPSWCFIYSPKFMTKVTANIVKEKQKKKQTHIHTSKTQMKVWTVCIVVHTESLGPSEPYGQSKIINLGPLIIQNLMGSILN